MSTIKIVVVVVVVTVVCCESVNLIGYIIVFYLLIENSYAQCTSRVTFEPDVT